MTIENPVCIGEADRAQQPRWPGSCTRPMQLGRRGSLDPLVTEITWHAWRLVAASPATVQDASAVRAVGAVFDRMLETAWLPGRVSLLSELVTEFVAGAPRLLATFAVGVLGARGTTAVDGAALSGLIQMHLDGPGMPYRVERVDPRSMLDLADEQLRHACLIRQRRLTVEAVDAHDQPTDIEVLSRWNPTLDPWSATARALLTRTVPTRIRATVLPTEITVTDRQQLARAVSVAEEARRAAARHPDLEFQADRALATLVDLRASFSTPVLCAELAVTSAGALPEVFLREIGACFTSEVDVLRYQGRSLVAAQRLMLGGFELEPATPELADAHRAGVPLRGGLHEQTLTDLVTLYESPLGWPIPAGALIPTVPAGVLRTMPVPPALTEGVPIGTGADERPVQLPHASLERHAVVVGATGSGKTTVLAAAMLDDLRHRRPFLFVDCHGQAADRIVAHADRLGVEVAVVDPVDAAAAPLGLLPLLQPDGVNRADVERAASQLCEAIVASLADQSWAGPRWHQIARAMCLLAAAHGVHLADVVSWLSDAHALEVALNRDGLPADVRATLRAFREGRREEAVDIREWVTSKFAPFTAVTGRRVVAAAGSGLSIPRLLHDRTPVVVNLAALPRYDASLFGHLTLSAILENAIGRGPVAPDDALRCYVDEAHRFPVPALQRIQAEGRKFGVHLMLATQALGQLDAALADIVESAAVQIAFRQTPRSALALAAQFDLPPSDLRDLPDLHAYVKVTGTPPCSVRIDPYPPCPPLRTKDENLTGSVRVARPVPAASRPRPDDDSAPDDLVAWLERGVDADA